MRTSSQDSRGQCLSHGGKRRNSRIDLNAGMLAVGFLKKKLNRFQNLISDSKRLTYLKNYFNGSLPIEFRPSVQLNTNLFVHFGIQMAKPHYLADSTIHTAAQFSLLINGEIL